MCCYVDDSCAAGGGGRHHHFWNEKTGGVGVGREAWGQIKSCSLSQDLPRCTNGKCYMNNAIFGLESREGPGCKFWSCQILLEAEITKRVMDSAGTESGLNPQTPRILSVIVCMWGKVLTFIHFLFCFYELVFCLSFLLHL